jgi:DNA-binding response OmpR family regulator
LLDDPPGSRTIARCAAVLDSFETPHHPLRNLQSFVHGGFAMTAVLTGRAVLIVEDEPLIAMEIVEALERAGARVLSANTLRQALLVVNNASLSAAVLDHGLSDGDSSTLCQRLKELDIPFVLHSGYSNLDGPCRGAPFVAKPASPDVLVTTLEGLLRSRGQTINP